ncbi:hypothetical protein [Legionella septentrionalis]|uniref:hypothetical protein n=1 Tax=Legionella septentrionalis TaxID=2498109 RepID=UPI000F8F4CF7|nr:hypothetical protein [Legionella septentrionalis]RUR12525.1 hypothetical protein ELY10_11495 [Legionella septentrionalis]
MPIKFGSALLSKMKKRYWELPHVKDNPFIIAIHDYHNENAMTWSRTALSNYLYGLETRIKNGEPYLKKITKHRWRGKEIDSGFFFNTDNSENISAVLFSNQATVTKFNRMGKLGGLGSKNVKMIRMSMLFDPNPAAFNPLVQIMDLDDPKYEESWTEGLVMFHNPNAKFPVNLNAFNDISHISFDEQFGTTGYVKAFDVLNSITYCFTSKK